METNIDEAIAPKLRLLLAQLSSTPRKFGGRTIRMLDTREEFSPTFLREALAELRHPDVAAAILPDQFAALARLAWRHDSQGGTSRALLVEPLRILLQSRWADLGTEVIRHAIGWHYTGRELFAALPQLAQAAELIDLLAEADDSALIGIERDVDFKALGPAGKDQLRRSLPALGGNYGAALRTRILMAASKKEGWTPWLKLFAILWHIPEVAFADAPRARLGEGQAHGDEELQAIGREVWSTLHADTSVRSVARLVLDLKDLLATSPPDYREVYVTRLRSAVGDDVGLRQAAIEALLWTGGDGARAMAIFAATHLARPDDLPAIAELTESPDRRVQYSASVVLSALQGPASGAAAPVGLSGAAPPSAGYPADGPPRTWLGNRLLEQMIEATASALEQQSAMEYRTHHGTGEEGLGSRFFAILSERLQMLEGALRQAAQALGDAPNASVLVRYRPVDKPEEGKGGVVRSGDHGPAPKFSADFCLVVNAFLDGQPLTRRAALLQAKRLHPVDPADATKGWAHSFRLDPAQTRHLLAQTTSSFYLFQGPAELQLGVSIIPAQLVEDLALSQAKSGAVLAAESVSHASEGFAEWFTYQLVALRTGDPLAKLIDKAERGPGSEPYPLLRYGTVEIEVRVGEPRKQAD